MMRDRAKLPGGGKIGYFWAHCKSERKCGRPPYDRLLTNPVLRADYRIIPTVREGDSRAQAEDCKTRDQGSDSTEPTVRPRMDEREEACTTWA